MAAHPGLSKHSPKAKWARPTHNHSPVGAPLPCSHTPQVRRCPAASARDHQLLIRGEQRNKSQTSPNDPGAFLPNEIIAQS